VRATMTFQEFVVKHPKSVVALIVTVVSVIAAALVLGPGRFGTDTQRSVSFVIGLVGIITGCAATVWWQKLRAVDDTFKKVGVSWGLMSIFAGLTFVLWSFDQRVLMGIPAIIAIVFWRIAKKHLALAYSTVSKKES
jgi:hypothetical protein